MIDSRGAELLRAAGGSLRKLSKRTGVDVATLSRLRSGALARPSEAVAAKLEATVAIPRLSWHEPAQADAGGDDESDGGESDTNIEEGPPEFMDGDPYADLERARRFADHLAARPGVSTAALLGAERLVLQASEAVRKAGDMGELDQANAWRIACRVLQRPEFLPAKAAVLAQIRGTSEADERTRLEHAAATPQLPQERQRRVYGADGWAVDIPPGQRNFKT
jgi:transcriptional regulator with XRE-family HTH domain